MEQAAQAAPGGALGAKAILLIGDEGTGKTTSLRNLPANETIIIQPNTKDLSWPGWEKDFVLKKNLLRVQSLEQMPAIMEAAITRNPNTKYLIIEDTTHLQNQRTNSQKFIDQNSGNAAFSKWNQFGADFGRMMGETVKKLPASLTVIFIGHTEMKDDGTISIQTAGKLLDNSFKAPSYFTYVFISRVLAPKDEKPVQYVLQTNHDGQYKAKTPMGMFKELYVPNDMLAVVKRIREYGQLSTPEALKSIN